MEGDIMKNKMGLKIRQVRQELGISMEEFGKLFNPPASKGVVSNWENGYNNPNNERLKRIAELGNVSVEYLTGLSSQRISEESALEIFKNIYFDYLSNGNNLEEKEIKRLKYFDNDNLDKVLEKAMKSYFSMPTLDWETEWTTLEDTSMLKEWLVDYLSELYEKEVLTNQNLIDNTIKNIPANSVVKQYGELNFQSIELSKMDLNLLKSESKETIEEVKRLISSGFFLTAHKYEASINDELKEAIMKILNSTREDLKKLKEIYPDKPSKIEQATYLHSMDMDIDLGWSKNGEQENDSLNLSESTKEFFIRIASDKLNKNI